MLGCPSLSGVSRRQRRDGGSLGAGVAQTPAILRTAEVCRALLGEELALPSVETRWCGDPVSLREIEGRFDDLLIRTTYPETRVAPIATALLTRAEREELVARIRSSPDHFVAQERVQASTTPALVEGKLSARAVMWRSFAVASPSGEPQVMPGGLARVAGDEAGMQMSMQTGAGSLDVWVLSDEPVTAFSMLPPHHAPVAISRGGADLPTAPPTTSTGWAATRSAPKRSRACAASSAPACPS